MMLLRLLRVLICLSERPDLALLGSHFTQQRAHTEHTHETNGCFFPLTISVKLIKQDDRVLNNVEKKREKKQHYFVQSIVYEREVRRKKTKMKPQMAGGCSQ